MLLTMRAMTDAARAICYENGVMADLADATGDAEAKAAAKAKNDLLTPISKAFSTDIANEVASIGVQIHGGMGFVEETGAAQYLRDARILPIYEGTNGIQAMDLVGRKLGNGDTIKAYMAEISDTAETCRQSNNPVLVDVAERLSHALDTLADTTDWLVAQRGSLNVLAGATPYLRLFGLVAGCHYLARGAHAVTQNSVEPNFDQRKLASAQFYAHNLLSAVGGLSDAVKAGNDMLDDIGESALAS